jgi:hypothetical protein
MIPNHYIGTGGIQVKDVMKAFMSPERYAGFCQGNIIKYILRYKKKNGLIDLEKCHDYLDELIDTEKKIGENYGAQQHRGGYVASSSNVQRRPNR